MKIAPYLVSEEANFKGPCAEVDEDSMENILQAENGYSEMGLINVDYMGETSNGNHWWKCLSYDQAQDEYIVTSIVTDSTGSIDFSGVPKFSSSDENEAIEHYMNFN